MAGARALAAHPLAPHAPVRIISMALLFPTARMRRCVPPQPGMVPMVTSGCPNTAFSPAMMMSHIMASSQPPPSAKPFTAAMTGFVIAMSRAQSANMLRV